MPLQSTDNPFALEIPAEPSLGREGVFLLCTRPGTNDLLESRPMSDPHSPEPRRRSEEQFRLLVEAVEDYAIFMLDEQGRVVSWNRGSERIKGYRPQEIIGQHFSRFFPPEDLAAGKPESLLEVAKAEGRVE